MQAAPLYAGQESTNSRKVVGTDEDREDRETREDHAPAPAMVRRSTRLQTAKTNDVKMWKRDKLVSALDENAVMNWFYTERS